MISVKTADSGVANVYSFESDRPGPYGREHLVTVRLERSGPDELTPDDAERLAYALLAEVRIARRKLATHRRRSK